MLDVAHTVSLLDKLDKLVTVPNIENIANVLPLHSCRVEGDNDPVEVILVAPLLTLTFPMYLLIEIVESVVNEIDLSRSEMDVIGIVVAVALDFWRSYLRKYLLIVLLLVMYYCIGARIEKQLEFHCCTFLPRT